MSLSDLVKGRKFEIPLDAFENLNLIRIQGIRSRVWDKHVSKERSLRHDLVLLVRELADLREKIEKLGPYILHKEDCPFMEDIIKDDKVLAHGQPCNCGLAELQATTTNC